MPELLNLIDKKRCPHKGFVWNDPITGRLINARSYANLTSEVTLHRVSNGIEAPPDQEIQDSVCRHLLKEYGEQTMKSACIEAGIYEPKPGGPGTILKERLQQFGINACWGCLDLASKMDAWGPDGCEENFTYIKNAMHANAEHRRWYRFVPFKEMGSEAIIRWAIAESRTRL